MIIHSLSSCLILLLSFLFKLSNILEIEAVTSIDTEWEDYKKIHNKKYTNERMRKEIWTKNRQFIKEHNLKGSFTLNLNKYSDLTLVEFSQHLNGFVLPKNVHQRQNLDKATFKLNGDSRQTNANVPISVDWRQKGYVSLIRDQGLCGCCYIFAATASLEGVWAKKYNLTKPMSISDQNFLDCTKAGNFVDRKGEVEPIQSSIIQFSYSANGCNGGNVDSVLQYNKFNGFVLLANRPYQAMVS